MRYIIFLIYVVILMCITAFCGDPVQAEPTLLDLKADNTVQMAEAYTNLYHAEEQGDVAGMKYYRQEILRLGEENRRIHDHYQASRDDDDDDDFGNTITEFREMNKTISDASEEDDDNLAQQIIRFVWFGLVIRGLLWFCWLLEWLLGWIPVLGPLATILLILVAVIVMVLGYLVPGIIPLILVSL